MKSLIEGVLFFDSDNILRTFNLFAKSTPFLSNGITIFPNSPRLQYYHITFETMILSI